jgi:hypothetical protein
LGSRSAVSVGASASRGRGATERLRKNIGVDDHDDGTVTVVMPENIAMCRSFDDIG